MLVTIKSMLFELPVVLTETTVPSFSSKPDFITIVTFDDSISLLPGFYSAAIEATYPTTEFLFCYSNVMLLQVLAMLVHLAIITREKNKQCN